MSLSKASQRDDRDTIEIMGKGAPTRRVQSTIAPEVMGAILDRLTDAYQHPVAATVREVISNAIDTTQRAGKLQVPVEVTVPTLARGMFVVKDSGEGMAVDDVEKTFSQYGSSTKRNDMGQTGAYGLGAKAPLAYCTEFRGVTTRDGVTTTFSMRREATGTFCDVHSVETTGQPNGTAIFVPVAKNDITKFRDAIQVYVDHSLVIPVSVDGVVTPITNYALLADDFILDVESNTQARVWIRKDKIRDLIYTRFATYGRSGLSVGFLLSGWVYMEDGYGSTPAIMFELKPGVVDFTTSRDEILTNSRSEALRSRVREFVANRSGQGVAEAIAVLDQLTPAERDPILRSFIKDIHPSADGEKFVFETGSVASGFAHGHPMDLFRDGELNLARAINTNYPLNAGFGFVVSPLQRVETMVSSSPAVTRILKLYSTSSRPQDFVDQVKLSAEGPATASVASFILELPIAFPDVRNLILVEDGSSEDLARIARGRKELATGALGYSGTMFLPVRNTKTIAKQIEAAAAYSSVKVARVKAKDILAELRTYRAKERARAKAMNPGVSELHGQVLDATAMESSEEVLKGIWKYGQSVSVDTLLKEDWLVVFANGHVPYILIGAANSGVKLAGRKIIQITPQQPKAAHFKVLGKKRRNILTTESFPRRSAAATEALEGRDFRGDVLTSSLKALDIKDYMEGIVYHGRVKQPVLRLLSTLAKEVVPDDKELRSFLRMAAAVDRDNRRPVPHQVLKRDYLVQAFGEARADRLIRFQNFISDRMEYPDEIPSFDQTMMSNLTTSWEKVERSPLTDAVATALLKVI